MGLNGDCGFYLTEGQTNPMEQDLKLINQARDAIHQAGKRKSGCGLLDLDFMAGFDWLDMSWV